MNYIFRAVLIIYCGLFPISALQAQAIIKPVKAFSNPEKLRSKTPTLIFPVVSLKNTAIAKQINQTLCSAILEEYEPGMPVSTALRKAAKEGRMTLDYEIISNRNNLLALRIYNEGCGAYCSNWYSYFNFDLTTGKQLDLEQLLDPAKVDSFKNKLLAEKKAALNKYKTEELGALSKGEIDSSTYNWAMNEVDDYCINTIMISQFLISKNTLEVFDPCDFPHAIRGFAPEIRLKYDAKSLAYFLNPDGRKWIK